MQHYIIIRLFHSLISLFAITIIVFGLGRITGNPIDVIIPIDATQDDFDRLERVWGLDRPLHEQYFTYMSNIFQGNFGESILWHGKSVRDLIVSRFPATLQLAAFAMVVSVSLALPIGVAVAVKKDTPVDYIGKIIALLGQSLPSFWLGLVLMWIFAVNLGWFPTSGKGGITHMVLPAIALGWYQVAAVMRLTRSSMLEVLDSEYVKLARIKGIPEWKVIWKHCLRNAAVVPVTYFGLIFATFLHGSVVIETVFAWPGVGLLAVDAVKAHDFPVVQTVTLFFGCIYIFSNLTVDIMYAYLDPRIRYT